MAVSRRLATQAAIVGEASVRSRRDAPAVVAPRHPPLEQASLVRLEGPADVLQLFAEQRLDNPYDTLVAILPLRLGIKIHEPGPYILVSADRENAVKAS